MAVHPRIYLELSPDLYARIQEVAARSGRPIEAVLVETLDLLFGATPPDWDRLAATIDALPDAQLWAVAHRRLPWVTSLRLRELTAQGQHGSLSDDERAELATLIDEADRLTVLRSRALLVLQRRGHNVQDQMQRGA
jgi:hypothetical protein